MPQALENKPEIYDYLQYYIEAFYELSLSRTDAFSYIPFSEIQAYCILFDVGDIEEFVRYIKKMDIFVVNLNSEKEKARIEAMKYGR